MRVVQQFVAWVADTYPRVYWLSGFTYPTGFLTAVLQVGGGECELWDCGA